CGDEPRRAPSIEALHREQRIPFGLDETTRPAVRLRRDQPQRAELRSRRTRRDASLGAGDRARHVVALDRLLGRAPVARCGARALAAALEVLRERERLGLPRGLEPRAREAMPERAIGLRQHVVRSLAEERVTERVLAIAGDTRRDPRDEHLPLAELVE